MNKKCIGLLLAIPALMGFGLTSCSNDEPILNQEVSSTKQVEVSFIAELGGASRASLTFDATKNLKFKWEQEDVVYAVNADNGKYLGKLTVSKVLEDPRNCEFKGTLNLPSLGEANLKFYYLGEKGKMEFDSETYLPKDIEVDYSAQTGTAAELDDYDLLKAERAYKSSENGKLGRLSFTRHFSTAQFVLKYNGEELALNGRTVTISAAEGDLYNKASLNYKSGEYTHVPGNITVTPSTNNFYLNLIPTENVKFKFTVTMDNGETFEGTKGGKIAEDTYYSDNLDPIVVEMTHEDGRDNKYDVRVIGNLNYEGSTAEDGKTINTTLPYEYTLVGNLEEPTREGFIFKGWGATAESTEAIATVKFDDKEILEKTVYAIWEKSTYKWTVTWKDGYTE
ncbi:MAG: InlB B-repeat-containing protein, partial [Muribaculaceae bacterium]|nr:InlB B-repeat-containing protein [Muribaculaceae bacterium]